MLQKQADISDVSIVKPVVGNIFSCRPSINRPDLCQPATVSDDNESNISSSGSFKVMANRCDHNYESKISTFEQSCEQSFSSKMSVCEILASRNNSKCCSGIIEENAVKTHLLWQPVATKTNF